MTTLPDGTILRPELVLLDDVQTRESAMSTSQSEDRLAIVNGDVLGMAGPDRKISAIACMTVIRAGDMADMLLDRDRSPRWHGEKCKLLDSIPTDEKLWDTYAQIRAESLRKGGNGSEATDFYKQHQAAMDLGGSAAWPARYLDDEASAIQHGMNLKIDDEMSFMAEYQGSPIRPDLAESPKLTADVIAGKTNGIKRGELPASAEYLTAFIDVHDSLLYWCVAGWSVGFDGWVCDYGTWPEQKLRYFTLRKAPHTLARKYPGKGREGAIRAGLMDLTAHLLDQKWRREDGFIMDIGRLLIDAGYVPDVVHDVCQHSKHAARLLPSRGVGITASMRPMSEYEKRRGDLLGHFWYLPKPTHGKADRHMRFDANYYKSFVHARFATALGDTGSLSLFGHSPEEHRLWADHLTAEHPIRTTGQGRSLFEWRTLPDKPDNHYFDCYSEDMEALTRNGWVLFSELEWSDELATVDLATDLIEYQRPTELIARRYEGEMIQFGGGKYSRIDLLVTPTHRMVIFAGQASKGPLIREAGELTIWDKIKTTATWKGDDSQTCTLPATGQTTRPEMCIHCGRQRSHSDKRHGRRGLCYACYWQEGIRATYPKLPASARFYPEVSISKKDLASFVGWYVAEGSCRINERKKGRNRGKTHVVQISQNQGAKQDQICELLDRLPWAYHAHSKGVVISNKQAYDLVAPLGNKYTKHVPQWVKDSNPEIIGEFIRCAVDGDGWRDGKGEAYATVSRLLADDMMELYLKIGHSVSARIVKAKAYSIRGHAGSVERCRQQYHVYRKTTDRSQLRDSKNKPNFCSVPYDGMVYCASVPNGTMIVRRNGKVGRLWKLPCRLGGGCKPLGCRIGKPRSQQAQSYSRPTQELRAGVPGALGQCSRIKTAPFPGLDVALFASVLVADHFADPVEHGRDVLVAHASVGGLLDSFQDFAHQLVLGVQCIHRLGFHVCSRVACRVSSVDIYAFHG